MEMKNLKLLHQDMAEKEIDVQLFRAKVGAAEFECLFVTGQGRPVLALAAGGGAQPKVFTFEVQRGYRIDAFLGDMYHDLRDIYFGRGKSTRKLQSGAFFEELHSRIPTEAAADSVPTPDQIARILGPEGM